MLAIVLLVGAISGCAEKRTFERASDGAVVYIDELSPEAKAAARARIVRSLRRGIEAYDFGVGDEIEVFFHIDQGPTDEAYKISIADELKIQFLSDSDSDLIVRVRPDGRISLPLLGSVVVAGRTVEELTAQLTERYKGRLDNPVITVNIDTFKRRLDDFVDVIGTPTTGRSLSVTVLRDGTVTLPLLPPLQAAGRTLTYLQDEIDAAYSALGYGLFVSLVPRQLSVGTSLVLGEVETPGRIDLQRPQTVLMAVGRAGGVRPTGAMNAVRIFYIGEDGQPRVRKVNLTHVLEDLKLEEDMIVPDNSIIYVPPSDLTKTGRLMDAIVQDILRFNGFSFGFTYQINESANAN